MNAQTGKGKCHFVKIVSRILCIALIGVFVCNTYLYKPVEAASKLTDANVQAMEEKIAEIERKQSELKNQIKSSQSEQYTLAVKKNNLDKQLSLAQDKIDATQNLLKELERSINDKIAEIAKKEEDLSVLYENFKDRIRISYEEGEASYLEMVLGAKSLSDFLSRIERVGSMLEYDVRVMDQYKTEKENLTIAKTELETSLAEQQKVRDSLLLEQETMKKQIENYEQDIKSLAKDEAAYQAQLKQYITEANKENARLEAYIKELEEKQKQQYVGGVFMWPLPLNFNYISSAYGPRTLYGMYDFHRGIDVAGSGIYGAPIYAVNGGDVLISTSHYSYGNYVLINHGGGKSTLYAHCSKLAVREGQTVKKGDIIGYVGSTGNSTGPHLHFEIRINGVAVDPLLTGLIVVPK